MITGKEMAKIFYDNGIDTFIGVPDSTTKELSTYLENNEMFNYIITSNEGNSVGYTVGYNIACKKISCVFLQNSGIGNIINPVLSLANQCVYDVPILYIIGWRGNDEETDVPQHYEQGKITKDLLELIKVKCYELKKEDDFEKVQGVVKSAINNVKNNLESSALLIRRGLFKTNKVSLSNDNVCLSLSRYQALKIISTYLNESDFVITGTGMISREWYDIRNNTLHNRDFMNVGAMGHASAVATGVKIANEKINVFCIEGDGSFLMHLGNVAYINKYSKNKFVHIVLNNGVHGTVGGQKTVGLDVDFCGIAKACNYQHTFNIKNEHELTKILENIHDLSGNTFIQIYINQECKGNIDRPDKSLKELKVVLSENLNNMKEE